MSAIDDYAAMLRERQAMHWPSWKPHYAEDARLVPPDANRAWLKRNGSSHRGIGARPSIRHLVAAAVDQSFLDEICAIEGLERLDCRWPFTASDLSGLRSLRKLRHLSIDSPRTVTDFTPLLDLPALRRLLIENARHLFDLEWLAQAHHLEVIGVEGSMDRRQPVASLRPLAGLRSLKGLFLTAVRLGDKDMTPLADCPSLELIDCARFAPRAAFDRLHRIRPDLKCTWFDPASWR